jgi:hypothetical protein
LAARGNPQGCLNLVDIFRLKKQKRPRQRAFLFGFRLEDYFK